MWEMQAQLDKEDPGARFYLLKDDGTKIYVPSRKSARTMEAAIADPENYSNTTVNGFVQLHLEKPS